MPSGEAHEVINLTDDIVPPRGARIEVYAWPEQGKDAATLILKTPEGTLEMFEAKLREQGSGMWACRRRNRPAWREWGGMSSGGALPPHCLGNRVGRCAGRWKGGMSVG